MLPTELIDISNLRIGLPMWYMKEWRGGLLQADVKAADALSQYSQVFNAIEGNTTLYGLPSADRARSWKAMAADDFRFSFKIPRTISQADDMAAALADAAEFRQFLQIMGDSIGLLMLQLPGRFGPSALPQLAEVLQQLQALTPVPVSVEVRHAAFFDKADNEAALLRLLADHHADRVVFDSRGLFADVSTDPHVLEGQRKKPRFPVHPVSTGNNPVIRFIGHSDWPQNMRYLQQWSGKLSEWLSQGKQPWLFIHTPANTDAPEFARWILQQLGMRMALWPGEVAEESDKAAGLEGQTTDLFGPG